MRGRKSQLQFTKASEKEKESKMNLGGHGRERRRCKVLKNVLHARNGICGKIKD